MATPRDLRRYEHWWIDLTQVAIHQPLKVQFPTAQAAARFRDRLHAFRRACRDSFPAALYLGTRLDGASLYLFRKQYNVATDTSSVNVGSPVNWREAAVSVRAGYIPNIRRLYNDGSLSPVSV